MTIKKFAYSIIAALALLLCVVITSTGGGAVYASVASARPQTLQAMYEAQNVWEDLQGAAYDGQQLDLNVYNFDERKNVQIISFIEFCYSPFTAKQSDYGLYVYVYNPRGLDWTKKPAENKLQLRYAGKTTSHFDKYPLELLNTSNAAGYEGLFYKFKVVLSDTAKAAILSTLNSTARVYEVSGIELCDSRATNAIEYKIANTYTYTGFAKGYGADGTDTDTLNCTSSGLTTLTLDVHPTFYRPAGSNGKDAYTQDSLHSVYFSIPNEILNEYGGLSAIRATWLNAVTAPFLVTGNKTIYQSLERYIGQDIGYKNTAVGYSIYGAIGSDNHGNKNAQVAYNPPGYSYAENGNSFYGWKQSLTQLNGLFYAANGNANKYKVSSAALLDWLTDFTKRFATSNGLILDKYSPLLFKHVDENFIQMNINADDKHTLTSEKISQNWWQKIFGGSYVASHTTFDNIEAIHKVTDEDFKSNNNELNADKLYIDLSDYVKFKGFYDLATAADRTVFILRYQVSDYKAYEATEFAYGSALGTFTEKQIDTNAYFFQETANLDFDIIDVTCSKSDVKTVIACISSPKDILNPATPPLNTTTDTLWNKFLAFLGNMPWWAWVIVVVVVVSIVVGILSIFFPVVRRVLQVILKDLLAVFKVLWLIVSAPFRGIAALVKRGRECRERKRAEREKQEQTNNAQKKAKKPRKGKKKKNNNRRNN